MSATSCSSISAKSLPLLQSHFGSCANTLYRRTIASQGSVSSSAVFLYSQLFPSRFSCEGVALLSTSRTHLQPSRTIYTRSSPRATVEVAAPPSTGVTDDSSPAASPPERATWKANIDFKYIRDNKEAVIENCLIRKSTADVNRVVELYEDFLTKNTVSLLQPESIHIFIPRILHALRPKHFIPMRRSQWYSWPPWRAGGGSPSS